MQNVTIKIEKIYKRIFSTNDGDKTSYSFLYNKNYYNAISNGIVDKWKEGDTVNINIEPAPYIDKKTGKERMAYKIVDESKKNNPKKETNDSVIMQKLDEINNRLIRIENKLSGVTEDINF